MLRIGDKPILHHIMDEFISWGFNEFIVPVGYKAEIIFGYFLSLNPVYVHTKGSITEFGLSNCMVSLVNTGMDTLTGGRVKRVEELIDGDFFVTYGDGLSDIDLLNVLETHRQRDAIVTISCVRPTSRFGRLSFLGDGRVIEFGEKQEDLRDWINGGFAVFSKKSLEYIDGDLCDLAFDLYPKLCEMGKLFTVPHNKFWKCVDTVNDLQELENLYIDKGCIWIR